MMAFLERFEMQSTDLVVAPQSVCTGVVFVNGTGRKMPKLPNIDDDGGGAQKPNTDRQTEKKDKKRKGTKQ